MHDAGGRGLAEGLHIGFDVLGPPRAWNDGSEIPIGTTKPNQALAVLLASSGHEASAARLLDEVWHRDPDTAGMNVLKNAVYQLNEKFEEHFDVRPIHSSGGDGYRVEQETVVVDAVEFEDLVRRVEQNRLTADALSVHRLAETAIGLWHGSTAFLGLDGISVVDDYSRSLSTRWLSTQKIRFEAALQLDLQSEIMAELEALCREHPFDESLCASLMTATARTGSQAEALRLYDEFRKRLVDSTGVDPSPDLTKLYMHIIERHDSVVWRPAGAAIRTTNRGSRRDEPTALHDDIAQLTMRSFAGREPELAALRLAVDAGDTGSSEPQVVTGSPGMGKSRLVAALAQEEANRGRTVLYGRCSPERSGALDPIADMLQAERERVRGVSTAPGAPTGVLPLPEIDPAIELERRVEAAAEALLDRCRRRAPLLIVEDAQWVDPSTLAAVSLAADRGDGARIVLTTRSGALSPGADDSTTLVDWLEQRQWTEIPLAPLDDAAVEELVVGVLPERHRHRSESVSHLVQRQARGIPVLITEVLHAVEYEATKRRPFSLAHIEAVSPDSLRSAVHRRLLRLSREGREALKAAAVAGPSFQLDVLAAVIDTDEDALSVVLEECVSESLLTESASTLGQYSFAHGLLRDAILVQVGMNRRARLHRDFAAALSRLRGPMTLRDQALHHLGALPLGDATEAVRVTAQAAQIAVGRYDVDDAIDLFHRAVIAAGEHEVPLDLQCDVLTALTRVQSWSGESVAAAATLDAAVDMARRADDSVRFAEAVLAPGPHHRVVTGSRSRLDLLRESADLLRTGDPSALLISIEANLLAESLVPGRYEKVDVAPDDLVQRAMAVGDPSATIDALFAAHAVARATPDLELRTGLSEEIIRIAETVNDLPQHLCGGLTCQIYDLMSEGRFDVALRTAERLNDVAERASMPRYRWRSMVVRSALLRVRGEFEAADTLSGEAVTVGRSFDRSDAEMVFGMQMHDTLRFAGGTQILRSALEAAAVDSTVKAVHLLLAQAQLSEGEIGQARVTWRTHRDEVISHDPDELWLATLALAAELVTTGIDDPEAARQLQAGLEPFTGQWVPAGIPVASWGPIDRYLAGLADTLGQHDEARSLLGRAEDQCKKAGAPKWGDHLAELARTLQGPAS